MSGRLVAVVGTSGVGKTTLVRALHQLRPAWHVALEQPEAQPFQPLMAADPARYALANQIDFLLRRAAEERALRRAAGTALVDGGLDLDFHGFTALFHQRGDLSAAEMALCARLYRFIRAHQPPPELFVYVHAPLPVIAGRHRARGRPVEMTGQADLAALDRLVAAWIDGLPPAQVVRVAADDDAAALAARTAALLENGG